MSIVRVGVWYNADTSSSNILLDLNLPRKDGQESLKEFTDDPALARIPVIVLSSSKTEEDVAKA